MKEERYIELKRQLTYESLLHCIYMIYFYDQSINCTSVCSYTVLGGTMLSGFSGAQVNLDMPLPLQLPCWHFSLPLELNDSARFCFSFLPLDHAMQLLLHTTQCNCFYYNVVLKNASSFPHYPVPQCDCFSYCCHLCTLLHSRCLESAGLLPFSCSCCCQESLKHYLKILG